MASPSTATFLKPTPQKQETASPNYQYLPINQLDRPDQHNPEPSPLHLQTSRSRSSKVTILLITLLLTLSLYGLYTLLTQTLSAPISPQNCNCGPTIEHALAANCTYDSISSSWLPPHCRDDVLTAEFNALKDWDYYLPSRGNPNLPSNETLSLSELAALADEPKKEDRVFWTTLEWHVQHCVFYWKKESRSKALGTVMERAYVGEGHVGHCVMTINMALGGADMGVVNTRAVVGLDSDMGLT